MDILKNKLNYLEKNLSIKHLGRDIIGLQLLLIVSMVISMLLFLWIVNTAVGSESPEQVIQNAEEVSGYGGWILWVITNILVMVVSGKAKREANKTKQEIITEYIRKEGKEE